MKKTKEKKAQIWAIGGGKGGTGKTLILCQLAVCLAAGGKRVILIDSDFVAPNINFFLGVTKNEKSLMDFFEKEELLENLIQETKIKNLGIILPDKNRLASREISHKQKMSFIRHLPDVMADYILIDLSGGSNLGTIDIFLKADKKIVVTDLEIISIDNLLHFIRNAYFRKLNFSFNAYGLQDIAKNLWENRDQYGIITLQDLVYQVNEVSNRLNDSILKKLAYFQVYLIINKVRKSNDILEGFSIKSLCKKYLGVEAFYSGYLEYDNQMWKNLSLVPSKDFKISPRIEQEMIAITENINTGNQIRIDRIKNV